MKHTIWCLLFCACCLQAQPIPVTVDFTNRSGGHLIPGPMAGWNGPNATTPDSNISSYINSAQLWNVRYFLTVYSVCTASGCGSKSNGKSFSKLDSDLNEIYSDIPNAHVTVVIDGTPTDLSLKNCPADAPNYFVDFPSNVTTWAELARQIVQHVDQQSYSAIIEAYEIENEPDNAPGLTSGICWPSGTSEQTMLHDYKSIYAAAAPVITNQLTTDGKSALVGGPVLCCQGNAQAWLSTGYGTESAFLQDTTTANYVGFVSAHHYGNQASTWGAEFTNEQATTYRNFANDVYGYIHAGKQPKASSTPFWINEYDSGAGTASNDACRFAACNGLFQGVFIADQIARVYDSNQGMARTWMFQLYNSDNSDHCIFSIPGVTGGCGSASTTAMPTYNALVLINGTTTNGLDLGSGGYAVKQYSTGQPSDTVTAGWYNSSGNHFYIVNAGANTYSVEFVFKNTSYTSWTGAGTHLWDSVNNPTHIFSQSITMTKSNTSDWTTSAITLPPYSILGVGFDGQ